MNQEEKRAVIAQIVDDYDLEHGNGEILFQDDSMECYLMVEAPRHSTYGVSIPTEYVTRADILLAIAGALDYFDAEEEFEELWSPEFGKHNNFTAFGFVELLKEDAEFFSEVRERMLDEWRRLERDAAAAEEETGVTERSCPICGEKTMIYDSKFASDLSYASFSWQCTECGAKGNDLYDLVYFDTDVDSEEE